MKDPVEIIPERVYYVPDLLGLASSARLLEEIRATTTFHQMRLNVGDNGTDLPRLVSWHADPGLGYRYSGITHPPADWTAPLLEVRELVRAALDVSFNGVLLNLYRNGRDSIGRHADREDDLVPGSPIVGVSLGAPRIIRFRKMGKGRQETHDLELGDGSMLVMVGDCQRTWTHEIKKVDVPTGERLSLTFRQVRP